MISKKKKRVLKIKTDIRKRQLQVLKALISARNKPKKNVFV